MNRSMRLGFVTAVATILIGCSVTPSYSPSAPPTPEPSSSALASSSPSLPDVPTAVNPKVTVTPARILVDGETVRVAVRGFWGTVWLSECASLAVASSGGCGAQLAAQPFLITDDSWTGFASFVVRAAAASTPLGAQLRPCVARCVLVATLGYGYPYATTPLVFGIP
jgi:hypothetical protein